MKFVYPGGLWAFASVLAVIAVCLIRRKYDEKAISSVYLWKLAERFSKRNTPAQRLKRALLLALQLLSVALACLLVAQPLIRMPGADVHYVAILDGSASMGIGDGDGVTRFHRAVDALERDIGALPWGSSVSIVLAGDQAQILAQRLPWNQAESVLEGAKWGYGSGALEDALVLCQDLAEGDDAVCLYTDRAYAPSSNIQVRSVSAPQEWNLSVLSLTEGDSANAFTAQVVSGGKDAVVSFELLVDGVPQDSAMMDIRVDGEEQGDLNVMCPKDQVVTLSLTARQVSDAAHVCLAAHVEDGLAEDNEYQLICATQGAVRVLLVSPTPFFLSSALSAFPQVDLETAASPDEIEAQGYDLYVYEGCLPENLPQDGALWLIDPPAAAAAALTGATLGEELRGVGISPVESQEPRVLALQRDLSLQAAAVARFREVTWTGGLTPVLACGEMPVLLAGSAPSGCALILVPFDLQDSNLPLLADFIILIRNLLEDSVPPMLDTQDVSCGEPLQPQTLPLCQKLYVQLPDLSIRTLEAGAAFTPEIPGSYTLMQELPGGREKIWEVYAHIPRDEGLVNQPQEGGELFIVRDAGMGREAPQAQFYNPLSLLAGMVLVLLIVEWGMYHREKY